MEAVSLPSDGALKLVLGALCFTLELLLRAALRVAFARFTPASVP